MTTVFHAAMLLFGATGAEPALATGDEEAVKAALQSLGEAMEAGNHGAILDRFQVRRMLQQAREWGGVGKRSFVEDVSLVTGMSIGLSRSIVEQSKTRGAWSRIRTQRVAIEAGGEVAQAFCRITMAGDRMPIRFWLIRDGGSWKVFDFETRGDGLRFSINISSHFATRAGEAEAGLRMRKACEVLREAGVLALSLDHSGALELLDQVEPPLPAALDPGFKVARVSALLGLDEHEAALALAEETLGKYPDTPILHHLKGLVLLRAGRPADSIKAQQDYLAAVGDDPDGWLRIGEAYQELKDGQKAIEAYRRGMAADPDDADNPYHLGSLLLERGDRGEAVRIFTEAVRRSDRHLSLAAADLVVEEAYAELLALCLECARFAPNDPNIFYYQGLALRRLGRYREAVKALRLGMEKDAEEEQEAYWDQLAMTLAHLGRRREALEFAGKVSDGGQSAFLSAYVHALNSDRKAAFAGLVRALRADPELLAKVEGEPVFRDLLRLPRGWSLLECARATIAFNEKVEELREAKDWSGLLDHALKRAQGAPGDANALFYQGLALQHLRRFPDAERAYRAGLEKDAVDRRPYYWKHLGLVLAHLGRKEEALGFAEKLTAAEANRADGLYVRSYLHALAGREEDALKSLRELVELEDSDPCLEEVRQHPVFERLRALPEVRQLLGEAKSEID